MKVSFENIIDFEIPLSDFELNWRFNDPKYSLLPSDKLECLRPLGKLGSEYLSDYLKSIELHHEIPFKSGFFKRVENITIGEKHVIQKWLLECDIDTESNVFLSWNTKNGMIVPFRILIEYFEDFYYESVDDLTVFPSDLNWAILFFHQNQLYFGHERIK